MAILQPTRRELLAASLGGLAMPLLPQTRRRPNVVIILADDQGWGDLSINGNTNLSTPKIDSIARDGAILDRFYVCAVCYYLFGFFRVIPSYLNGLLGVVNIYLVYRLARQLAGSADACSRFENPPLRLASLARARLQTSPTLPPAAPPLRIPRAWAC